MTSRAFPGRLARRIRFALGGILATLLIGLAAAVGLGQLLLPYAADYPRQVASMLSRRLGHPVQFQDIQGTWHASGPELKLRNLRIENAHGGTLLYLQQARLRFNFGLLLWPGHHWIELSASGLQLDLIQNSDGRWQILGLNNGNADGGTDVYSLPVDLRLRNLTVSLRPWKSAAKSFFHAEEILVRTAGVRTQFAALIRRQGVAGLLQLTGSFSRNLRQGKLYLSGRNLKLAPLLQGFTLYHTAIEKGHGDLQLWYEWNAAHTWKLSSRIQLHDLALTGAGGRRAAISTLDADIWLQRAKDVWRLRYEPIPEAGQAQAGLQVLWRRQGLRLQARARMQALEIQPLLTLAGLLPEVSPALSSWVERAAPHGRVGGTFAWYGRGAYQIDAQLQGLGWAAVGKLPGVDHLQADLLGDEQAIALHLPTQKLSFRDPYIFRTPLDFDALTARLVAWPAAGGWTIGIQSLNFDAPGFAGRAEGRISLLPDEARPVVDLYAVLNRGKVAAAKLFWPINVMPPAAVSWLDRALVAGTLQKGRLALRGPLQDWPFKQFRGRFDATANFTDTIVNFDPHWPQAEAMAGNLEFSGAGLTVLVNAGSVGGNSLSHATARIDDLGQGIAAISADGQGDVSKLYHFIRQTPIGIPHHSVLKELKVAGKAAWGFTLVFPLHAIEDFRLQGQAQLQQVSLSAPQWNLLLSSINGAISFDRNGFSAAGLQTRFRGQPGHLVMSVGSDTGDPSSQLLATLSGRFSASSLVQGIPVLQPIKQVLKGHAAFQIGLRVTNPRGRGPVTTILRIDSDLAGVGIDLPVPLDKPAPLVMPLHLEIALPYIGSVLQGSLGKHFLRARVRIPATSTAPLAASLVFGDASLPPLPKAGLLLAGNMTRLDLTGWFVKALASPQGAATRLPVNGHIHTDSALLYGRPFKDFTLTLQTTPTALNLGASCPTLQGSVQIPLGAKQPVVRASLQKLWWPSESGKRKSGTSAPIPMTGISPGALPAMQATVRDFRLGNAHFGKAIFESTPIATGMRIVRLDTDSPNIHMRARGTWTGSEGHTRTQMTINFSAGDLGRMLQALGYPNLVAGGKTTAHINGTWSGAPTTFALDRMNGNIQVVSDHGRILEVRPGAGRLLGLFSIAELPRRLLLDFGDVFSKGFSFDSIHGRFVLKDGNAYTQNLEIRGPSANIRVQGRTGLRARDYDQIVVVLPKLGTTLPLLGAVAGGPVGAAAGLVFQGLFGKGLSKASAATYRITGSWEKPDIVAIKANQQKTLRAGSSSPPLSIPASPSSAYRLIESPAVLKQKHHRSNPPPWLQPARAASSTSAQEALNTPDFYG